MKYLLGPDIEFLTAKDAHLVKLYMLIDTYKSTNSGPDTTKCLAYTYSYSFSFIYLGHSRKDCNTGPTRGESGASPGHLTYVQKSV